MSLPLRYMDRAEPRGGYLLVMRHENPYRYLGYIEIPDKARQKMHSPTGRIVKGCDHIDQRWSLQDGDQVILAALVSKRMVFEGFYREVLDLRNPHLAAAISEQYTETNPEPKPNRNVAYSLYIVRPEMLMAKIDIVENVEDLGEHFARYPIPNPAGDHAEVGKSESMTVK